MLGAAAMTEGFQVPLSILPCNARLCAGTFPGALGRGRGAARLHLVAVPVRAGETAGLSRDGSGQAGKARPFFVLSLLCKDFLNVCGGLLAGQGEGQ